MSFWSATIDNQISFVHPAWSLSAGGNLDSEKLGSMSNSEANVNPKAIRENKIRVEIFFICLIIL